MEQYHRVEMDPPKLVSAVDESGNVLCIYDRDAKAGTWEAVVGLT